MAYSDDFLSPRDHCEICGAELEDEIIIQEFADGSLARLCPECAAGAALTDLPPDRPEADEGARPRKRRLFSRGRAASPSRHRDDDDTASWDTGPLDDDESYLDEEPLRAERPAASEQAALDAQWAALEAPSPPLSAKPADPVEPRPSAEALARPAAPPADAPARPAAPPEPARQALVDPGERVDQDLLDKTRELLMPVADLIALQGDMQSALERLAASLERFAAEILTDAQGKSSVINNRLQQLERELEITRGRLHEAESLLPESVVAETSPDARAIQWPEDVAPITLDSLVAESRAAAAAAVAGAEAAPAAQPEVPVAQPEVPVAKPEVPVAQPEMPAVEPEMPAVEYGGPVVEGPARVRAGKRDKTARVDETASRPIPETLPWTVEPDIPAVEHTPARRPPEVDAAEVDAAESDAPTSAPAKRPPAKPDVPEPEIAAWDIPRPEVNDGQITGTFAISEVQAAQRYYNESTFVDRIRDVRRSLGRPKASLVRLAGQEPQAMLTVFWDIVWYQYLIYLRRDMATTAPRVILHREGMDLDELAFHFRDKNSTVNDDGRLDASELEVHLLSDPSVLITDMVQEETQMMEDATEEIWEQRISPEFKWDD